MKRGKLGKLDVFKSLPRQRSVQILIGVGLLYLLLVTVEIPFLFRTGFRELSRESSALPRPARLNSEAYLDERDAPTRPLEHVSRNRQGSSRHRVLSSLSFDLAAFDSGENYGSSDLYRAAKTAWKIGNLYWKKLESGSASPEKQPRRNRTESCPGSASLSGSELAANRGVMVIPCGLTLGSHVTLVGKPRAAHEEESAAAEREASLVSEFRMELQGLKTVEGEEPPRVMHFNPRLRGDWSGKPVLELNTCYRQQWGTALRCEGWKSTADEETVDGQVKCEKWIRGNDNSLEETKASWWLGRLIGRTKKVTVDWPYPFAEEKLFVLTVSAGLEGYHINVDGRHVTSFPYRTGFTLEDATGLYVSGDIDVHSVYAASLPSTHPSFAPQQNLELSSKWAAPPVPEGEIELLIGILSAGSHFSERMAVRKSWMQHKLIKSSKVVARFFVALNARKEVNAELLREAEFFGDIVIVPYMDNYDLVVLKTVAICEHGVRAVSAKYIMKCDDDTFVRVDEVLSEAQKIPRNRSFYIGNINYHHKPLRAGKWAVTYEEWPEEDYPPYANGPGYIVSSDIANFIVSEFRTHNLRLFKMEDVSMGMWVEKFNSTKPVEYVHSLRFCQYGCVEDYFTAHYQSPRQMMCMWDKLQRQIRPQCCSMR